MIRRNYILIIFSILVLGMPLIGAFLSDRPISAFTAFPPLTVPAEHMSFSWRVFMLYFAGALVTMALIGYAAGKRPADQQSVPAGPARSFPWWGWVSLVLLLISWFFAWTRFSWFASFQSHTFICLWISYICLVNALCFRQSGRCPLLQETVFFAALFPLSAVFWWFFEYLNQFAQNWFYTGVDYGPAAYSIHATISFSTVLPAVYTSRMWLANIQWFKKRFHGLPSLQRSMPKSLSWLILLLSCAGLVGIALRSEEFFALVWLAPLALLTALQHIAGRKTLFTSLTDGDWRPAVSAAMSALLCGFFWEMWNYYSLAKWVYSVPFVYRFKIFEMPVLGYLGYLPFGILCIELVELVRPKPDSSEWLA